ncbi:hypothetical protein J3Q64DRAFT_1829162 [Phycomyces blakesleeanus]|uniref:SET domain-containing protein n=2 Tax=Phycomyces blakesleeanus TaxID=4837 RepID=A0A167QH41_PHYB8|nr:hypothetical protein PHYBLDRAFT_139715 [Phycomyces blakesleeanus NRRL 1555(-)]OAD79687.1 hypothetical protein PHYBLDRAFT_139715 [Phycomyces blakesleeanus NRRL 1555(-)]|eukprot:XP_018297727.1 hypothetical protein PHYBLDRAFT_139715 [Phycomyces blakesleeanus NRRL 1555(-)]
MDSSVFESRDLPVKVRISPTKGREFLAKTRLEAQQTLFRVFPYATAIFDSHKKRVCAHCLCVHPTRAFSTRCTSCDQIYFCSLTCSEAYLSSSTVDHSVICGLLRKLATFKSDPHTKSVAKLVILCLWERRREAHNLGWDRSDNWWNPELAAYSEDALTSSFEQVQALESHYNDWPEDDKKDWRRMQQFLYNQLSTAQLLTPHETLQDIMHLVSRIESNGFGIFLENKTAKGAVLIALFPLASLFNHDCGNNCEVEQCTEDKLEEEGTEVTVEVEPPKQNKKKTLPKTSVVKIIYPAVFSQPRGTFRVMKISTVRAIEIDEALTISYIDATLPVSARRQLLLDEYYFKCQCERCIKESSGNKK